MTEINDLLAKPECLVAVTTRDKASLLVNSLLCASNIKGVYMVRAKEVFPTEKAFPAAYANLYNQADKLWAVYALKDEGEQK